MEVKNTNMWWLKNKPQADGQVEHSASTNSLVELLEKEGEKGEDDAANVDVGSIIDEINRVAAQSPLGPYAPKPGERSVDELMKEAERIYIESSKSFEQLSQRSKTSQNVSEISDKDSTPTPKSVSPLPDDDEDSEFYSDDFSLDSRNSASTPSVKKMNVGKLVQSKSDTRFDTREEKDDSRWEFELQKREIEGRKMLLKDNLIKALEEDNARLKAEVQETKVDLERARKALQAPSDVENVREALKDAKELNTALQLQLDTITQTHHLLKTSQEELITQNRNLEKRLGEVENSLSKYKHELLNVQRHRDKLLEAEIGLNKLLDVEKLQTKSLKAQNETDAKCILDLNRQIKEMERIIARKHPDSVSALIVAAKGDPVESNLTARKVLEDRIKTLETELLAKEKQSSQVFADIQTKFSQVKTKYESHIEDLELHVNDLKSQLKKRTDCYDMYTQTVAEEDDELLPVKECKNVEVQTENAKPPRPAAPPKINPKANQAKSETHLLATIRGLQADLTTKDKTIQKLQREIDELRKTNKRLQKEREGSLKSLSETFRSRKTASEMTVDENDDPERPDFEKIKRQLEKIENDYQNLKKKRIHDLNALQEAHEREIAQYIQNLHPLREQLELQQLSINTLQSQLTTAKEELAVVKAERVADDELQPILCPEKSTADSNVQSLQRKLAALERRYEERDRRFRAIVENLAQKNVTNRNCEQCAQRQRQLIGYKKELDSLLASLRALK